MTKTTMKWKQIDNFIEAKSPSPSLSLSLLVNAEGLNDISSSFELQLLLLECHRIYPHQQHAHLALRQLECLQEPPALHAETVRRHRGVL